MNTNIEKFKIKFKNVIDINENLKKQIEILTTELKHEKEKEIKIESQS